MIGAEKGQANLVTRQDRVSDETVTLESLPLFVGQGNTNGLLNVGLETLKTTELDIVQHQGIIITRPGRASPNQTNTWSGMRIWKRQAESSARTVDCVEAQICQFSRKYY